MLKVVVLGGGPAGLSFAILLAEQAELAGVTPERLCIEVYELRVMRDPDDRLVYPSTQELGGTRVLKNRRREQVVTLQHSTLQLLDSATEKTRKLFDGSRVWRNSENIAIRDLEDSLLARAQEGDTHRFIKVKTFPDEVRQAMRQGESRSSQPVVRKWFEDLDCDFIVGADGANSLVREYYEADFKPRLLRGEEEDPDYAIGVGFEDLEGWTPQSEALNLSINLSQNRYYFNATDGRRGYLNIRLTPREFEFLQERAGAPCKFSLPCKLWDVYKPQDESTVPVYKADPELLSTIEEGLRLFGIPTTMPTTIVAFVMDPKYVENFHIRDGNRRVFLIGDAAMSHHFWPGRGLNTGLRAAVGLARAVRDILCNPATENDQANSFQEFMTELGKNEISGRSGVMFGANAPKLPEHLDNEQTKAKVVQAATAKATSLADVMVDRCKGWRESQQSPRKEELRPGEPSAGWPHVTPEGDGVLSDQAVAFRFSGANALNPYILQVMQDSGFQNPRNLTGCRLPRPEVAQHEVLPSRWLEVPAELPEDKRKEAAERLRRARADRQERTTSIHKRLRVQAKVEAIRSQAAKEVKRLQEEAELVQKDVEEFYDTVVSIPNFDSLRKEGWKFVASKECEAGNMAATRIAIIGNFKKGKTWFLSKLCDVKLNHNEVIHTPGLCSKALRIKGKQILLLDTKGENSALSSVDRIAFQDRKAEESLIREVACDISDAFLYVVGQVGYDEQLTLMQLLSELQQHNKRVGSVIVVHNLRHLVAETELRQAWDEITNLYTQVGTPQETAPKIWEPEPGVHVSYLQGEMVRGNNNLTTSHFLLGRYGTEAGRDNDMVIECIKDILGGPGLPTVQHEHFLVEFQTAMQAKIGNYYQSMGARDLPPTPDQQPAPTQKDMEVVVEEQRESSQDCLEDGCDHKRTRGTVHLRNADHLQLRPMDIGTFVDKHSQTEFARYSIKDTGNRQLKVEIVVPGFDPKKHSKVFSIEDTSLGPKIIVDPGDMADTFPDMPSDRVLTSLHYPPSEDTKYTIQVPIKVRGHDKHGGDARYPRVQKEERGIVTMIWDIVDDTLVFPEFD